MSVTKIDKHKDYVRYATHCLETAPLRGEEDDRAINREMAVEWLKLADEFLELSKLIKSAKAM
jgi:hypothetical protein